MPYIEIHFKGSLDASWSDWFQGLLIQPISADETSLSGEVADNSAIYGVLSRMSSLGLTLISLNLNGGSKMNAVETTNLTKKFGDFVAVDRLDLSVQQGELFALLGVNGAGKTTTIRMLSCLSKPTSGDATLLGDSIVSNSYAVKEKINVSPQETAVAPNLTVKENLELIAGIYGCNKKEAEEKANQMIADFGFSEVAKKKAKTLSGGWQRRLSIAMALISNPQILFLDEPTLGLDVLARRELWNVIEKLKGKITMILTTHYLEEVEALSDRVAVMANGRLKAIGTVTQLTEKTNTKNLEDAFVALVSEGGAK
jgi:ABC-2 type transport system ATP-binding protein